MNIRFLETVLWLAKLRTLKATAEQLYITHTAISSRIAALEQDLGVKLFEKSGQGFEPTPEGIRFIEEAGQIVESYHRLRRVMLDPSKLRGSLRIGLVTTLTPTVFPYLVKTLREEYPHVSLSVTVDMADRLIKDLKGGRLDLLLTSSWPQDPSYEIVPLCSFAMGLVASPTLGVDVKNPLAVEQLANYPFVGYPSGTDSQMRVESYFSGVNQVAGVHATNGSYGNVQLAVAGLGISAVPIVSVKAELAQGLLVLLPTVKRYTSVHYAAIFSKDGGTEIPRAVASLARQAAASFCEAVDPAHAWQDQPTHISDQ
ncbi:LysR family transcriptional regulator [Ottowia caeni]|uniref:LysR family transcriptional regulator n=1 Tax=Ottowia caeni TaxID=2870339 RepID=UPI001E3C819B|nr:LysR family transcriptional regulator [Ottowia caeni]